MGIDKFEKRDVKEKDSGKRFAVSTAGSAPRKSKQLFKKNFNIFALVLLHYSNKMLEYIYLMLD